MTSDVVGRMRALADAPWIARGDAATQAALRAGADEVERLRFAATGAQYREREAVSEVAMLRAALDAATPRLEAFGAIAHVVIGADDVAPEAVLAACTELPFVRIENRRLRDDLDATTVCLDDARERLDDVAAALGMRAEWDGEWGDRVRAALRAQAPTPGDLAGLAAREGR